MIVFLFGLPGVGKTYIGQLMEQESGACYWDGDEALTDEMKRAVREEQPFTREMTAQLSTTIANKIKELKKNNPLIIVSQAMLRESDRQWFLAEFDDLHFIYVRCEQKQTSMRIAKRDDFVTVSYFEKLIHAFEPHRIDAESYPTIDNYKKTDEELITAFNQLINIPAKLGWQLEFFADGIEQKRESLNPEVSSVNKA